MRLPCRSFCVGALSLALMATSACAHDLTVEVLGARSDKGTVDGALYADAASWLKTPRAGERQPAAARVLLIYRDLPAGRYALSLFHDENGKMNRDVRQAGGALLLVSQFTLYGDCSRGRRPSFDDAAPAAEARLLYEYFVARARQTGIPVETGVFQAMMSVHLENDGPVTLLCESPKKS